MHFTWVKRVHGIPAPGDAQHWADLCPLLERRKHQAKLLSQTQKTLMEQKCPHSLPTVTSDAGTNICPDLLPSSTAYVRGSHGWSSLRAPRQRISSLGLCSRLALPHFIHAASLFVAQCLLFLLQNKPHLKETPAAEVLAQNARKQQLPWVVSITPSPVKSTFPPTCTGLLAPLE